MIKVLMRKNALGMIVYVRVKNHGSQIVCAGVSVLVLNTVNALENFTDVKLSINYKESGGFIEFAFPKLKNGFDRDASLLLNTLHLGLYGLKEQYPDAICIEEEIV